MQTKNKQPFLKIIFFVIGQILSITLMAQSNLRFEKLEMNDAPSIVSVDYIFEDSRGFMWFGTYSGLIMYDGYKATKFEHNPNDPLSISDNKIRKIYEDEKGNLWVGTQNGLNYFDIRKRTFKHYIDSLRNGMGSFEVNDIKKGLDNSLWIANVDGLYKLDADKGQFKKQFPQPISRIAIVNAIEFKDNRMFIATSKGLFFKDNTHNEFNNIHLNPRDKNDSVNVTALYKDLSSTFN